MGQTNSLDFDCGRCNSRMNLIGERGVCIPQNETCVCPPGFSGVDDWFTYEDDCHVDEKVKHVLHVVAMIFAVLSMLTCFGTAFFFSVKWQFVHIPSGAFVMVEFIFCNRKRRQRLSRLSGPALAVSSLYEENKSNNAVVTVSNDLDVDPSSSELIISTKSSVVRRRRHYDKEALKKIRARRLMSLLMLITFGLANIFYIIYLIYMLNGYSRMDGLKFLDFVTCSCTCALVSGLFPWYYSIYLTLPDAAQARKMFRMDNYILVRHPRTIPIVLLATLISLDIAYFVLAMLYIAYSDDALARHTLDELHFWMALPFAFPPLVLHEIIVRNVATMLSHAIDTFQNRLNNNSRMILSHNQWKFEISILRTTLSNVKVMRWALSIPVSGVLLLGVVSSIVGTRYQYLFYTLSIIMGSVASMIFGILASFHLDGMKLRIINGCVLGR